MVSTIFDSVVDSNYGLLKCDQNNSSFWDIEHHLQSTFNLVISSLCMTFCHSYLLSFICVIGLLALSISWNCVYNKTSAAFTIELHETPKSSIFMPHVFDMFEFMPRKKNHRLLHVTSKLI